MRDIDGASEGELESNLSRSKRYLIVFLRGFPTIIKTLRHIELGTLNFFYFHRSRSMGTSEDDSDYAYIDRSTHSITGYLQSPTNTAMKSNMMKNSSSFDSSNAKKICYIITDTKHILHALLFENVEDSISIFSNPPELFLARLEMKFRCIVIYGCCPR